MTKFTLLAAASVAAIAAAGAAQAGTLSGGVNAVPYTSTAAYVVATEAKGGATGAAIATSAGGFTVVHTLPTTGFSIGGGGPDVVYRVTFTATGGTLPTGNDALTVTATDGAGAAAVLASAVINSGARTTTSVQYIVTIPSAAAGTARVINSFNLTTNLSQTAETAVTVASNVELLAGGVSTAVDAAGPTTAVDYKPLFSTFKATKADVLAALPDFKSFTTVSGTAGVSSATIGTALGVTVNTGTFYRGIAANTAATVTSVITGGTLTVTSTAGGQLDKLATSFTGLVAAPTALGTKTDSSAAFTLSEATAEGLFGTATGTVVLTQPSTAVVLTPASYTATFAPTVDTVNFDALTLAGASLGSVSLDGVNFIAPWVGGSQAATKSVIRLSNGGAAASGIVTVRLSNALARAAGVTTGPGAAIANQTCATSFTIPNTGDLQLGQGELKACFGDFLRGDVQITIQSASASLTAKMRQVESDGTTYESSLGRSSGSTAAGAAF